MITKPEEITVNFTSGVITPGPRKLTDGWTIEIDQELESLYYHPPWYLRVWDFICGRGYYYSCLDTEITSMLEEEIPESFTIESTPIRGPRRKLILNKSQEDYELPPESP